MDSCLLLFDLLTPLSTLNPRSWNKYKDTKELSWKSLTKKKSGGSSRAPDIGPMKLSFTERSKFLV